LLAKQVGNDTKKAGEHGFAGDRLSVWKVRQLCLPLKGNNESGIFSYRDLGLLLVDNAVLSYDMSSKLTDIAWPVVRPSMASPVRVATVRFLAH